MEDLDMAWRKEPAGVPVLDRMCHRIPDDWEELVRLQWLFPFSMIVEMVVDGVARYILDLPKLKFLVLGTRTSMRCHMHPLQCIQNHRIDHYSWNIII
jgi:hypothetical protein